MYNYTVDEVTDMEGILDFYISDIYTIIQKREIGDFHFVNPRRQWDGFVLFTDGNGTFYDRKGDVYSFSKGTLLPLKKGDRYEIHSIGSCCYITSAYDIYGTDGKEIPELPSKVADNEKLYRAIEEICEIWQRHTWDSIIICRAKLTALYIEIFRQLRNIDENNDSDINKALQYIHKNFDKSYSFDELCRLLSISPSYMRAKFKKYTGVTISEYRDRLRISSAREMLESGHFTLKEIAADLGYCDAYHFSKSFKASNGFSPGQYKRNRN